MKTIKQLLRQRVKTIFGIILMTMAAAILCICVGQSIAARTTIKELDNSFATIALREGTAEIDGRLAQLTFIKPEGFDEWVNEIAQNNPNIVKAIANHGVLSAYIPELTPLNFTAERPFSNSYTDSVGLDILEAGPEGMPYTCAALTFTLEEMSEPLLNSTTRYLNQKLSYNDFLENPEDYDAYLETLETVTITSGYTVKLSGTVTGVVSLQEGFRDPTGMTLRITLQVQTLEELEALELSLGGEYLAFGMNYTDADWIFRSRLASDARNPVEIECFEPDKLKVLEGKELELWQKNSPGYIPYAIYAGWKMLSQEEYEQANSVTMSMGIIKNPHRAVRDEDGVIIAYEKVYEWTVHMMNGEQVNVPLEEYIARYRIPMLAKLDTTAEDFLASEEGKPWREALEWAKINYQAFGVLGVDRLNYVATFAKEQSRITVGRDFTEEELATGAKVCLIHEAVAEANDLALGDTITLSFYEMDEGLPGFQPLLYTDFVPAYFYFPTERITETAEYTIVGFWRGQQLWVYDNDDPYALSPNMLIVPNSSVESEMKIIPGAAFTSLLLYNGMVEDFRSLAGEVGYQDAFVFYDQGYTAISENFHNYDEMAEKTLLVGAAAYGVLLLLFLLLFPASRRKMVQIMCSLGEPYGKRFLHVAAYAAALLLPASVLGAVVGMASWQSVVSALVESTESTITMAMNPLALTAITLAQFVLALLLSALVALPVARPFGMSKKG